MARKIGMQVEIAEDRAIAAAIGNHFDDDGNLLVVTGRHRVAAMRVPSCKYDPQRIDGFNLERKIVSDGGIKSPC